MLTAPVRRSRSVARSANSGSVSAAKARRPSVMAATEAEHRPPNGSHNVAGSVTAEIRRS